jgi:hypothetical protein
MIEFHPKFEFFDGSANDVLRMEIDAAGTEFAADATGRAALETQFDGNKWMITRNTVTGVLHWDLVRREFTLQMV